MMLKRIISLLCIVLMFATITTLVLADETTSDEQTYGIYGIITVTENDSITVSGQGLTEDSPSEVKLLTHNARIFDMITGQLVDVEDLEDNAIVQAIFSTDVSQETPPEALAYEIRVNLLEEGAAQLKIVAQSIFQSAEDTISIVSDDGSIVINITEDTIVKDNAGADIDPTEIATGTSLLVWHGAVDDSTTPEQADASKIIVMDNGSNGGENPSPSPSPTASPEPTEPTESPEPTNTPNPTDGYTMNLFSDGQVTFNDQLLTTLVGDDFPYSNGNVIMFPLRVLAEATGYTVTWHGEDYSVTISKADESYRIKIGDNNYLDGNDVVDFDEGGIELTRDKTFVPANFFANILDCTIILNDF